MKNATKFKAVIMVFILSFLCSCNAHNKGSASDRTSNGSTNGNGKVPKSEGVHNYKN